MALSRKLSTKIYEIKAHTGKVTSLDLGETGRVLVTGGSDRNVNLWAIGEEKCFMSLPGHNGTIDCVRFAYNDDFVYSADDIGIIRRWDLNAQSICSTLNGHMKSVKTLDFNPSGEYVVSGSNDTTVRLWDVRNQNRCIKTYRGHIANVNSVKFSPDGLWIASAGTEGSIIIWDIRKSKEIAQLTECGASPVTCIQYHPNEFLLAAGRNDGSVDIYDLETNQLISKTESSNKFIGQPVKCISFSENGECLFVGKADGITVIGWEPNREFDRIESTWSFLSDIKVVNNQLICGSHEREIVSVYALSIDRVFPFFKPPNPPLIPSPPIESTSPFSSNQPTRKSFTRGSHKLRLSIGSSNAASKKVPNKVLEEEYDETPSPSLDGGGSNGGNSSPNLSIEIIDNEDSPIPQNGNQFEPFLHTKKQSTYNYPSLSSTTSSRSSGLDDRLSSVGGGMGPSSLKMSGELDLNKFEKIGDSYDSDLGYNPNELDTTQIVPNYEDNDSEDFPINIPQADYAPRYNLYSSSSQQNLHHNNQQNYSNHYRHSIANKPAIPVKPKPPFLSASSSSVVVPPPSRKSSHHGIPVKLSSVPSNTAERLYQKKLSGVRSVSTMELHKMDENMTVAKKSTVASRLKRDMSAVHHSNNNINNSNNNNNAYHSSHYQQSPQPVQQHVNKENSTTRNSRKIQVQIITKPPPRSKTSFDLRATPPIQNSLLTSPISPRSYTTDDENELHSLSTYHKQIFDELSNRYATLQLIRNSTRAQDVVGALKQAIKISGRTVFVDLLGAILEKTSKWNLDMCLLLLPEIYELLQSQHKFHHTRACDTLRVLIKNFLPIIQDNVDPWSAGNSLGVDITREERQRKCIESQQWLLRIRNLPSDNHIGSSLAQLQNMITF